MNAPEEVKTEAPKSWLPSHSSLQPYMKSFHKFVIYYIIDHNYNIDTRNIGKQVAGYIMSLERKQRIKLKSKGCAEGCYHRIFNRYLNQVPKSYNLILTKVVVC